MYTQAGIDQDDYWTPQDIEIYLRNELSILGPEHRKYFKHAVFDKNMGVLKGECCSLYFSCGKAVLI